MTNLSFAITGSRVEPYAASPLLVLRGRIVESTGTRVYAISLKGQVQIEPQRRRYAEGESDRLLDLFGTPARYGDTLRPMLWTHVSQTVLGFSNESEFDLPIPCTYDFDVAAHKYLSALESGEIPLVVYFSGNVFVEGGGGVAAELIPWTCEARYRLPVATWRAAMDAFFPHSAWLRVRRETFDDLCRYKAALALPTWEDTIARLLADAACGAGADE